MNCENFTYFKYLFQLLSFFAGFLFALEQGFWQSVAKNGELCGTVKVNCAANCAAANS